MRLRDTGGSALRADRSHVAQTKEVMLCVHSILLHFTAQPSASIGCSPFRPIIGIIEREIEQEQNNSARARRQLANINAIVVDAVLDLDVLCSVQPLREPFRPFPIIGLLRFRNWGMLQQGVLIFGSEQRHSG
jgi:hypothetical protein